MKPPAKAVDDTLLGAMGGRDRVLNVGDLFGVLKLEGLDAAQMDDLGGATDDMLAAQMEILAKMKFWTVERTPWVKIQKIGSLFSGRGTHNPVAPELGAKWYTLGKKVMRCIWDMLLHPVETGKGGLLSTQHIWKGLVKNRSRDSSFSLFLLKRNSPPLFPFQCHPTLLPGSLKPRKTKRKRKNTSSRCLNWQRSSNISVFKTRNLRNCSQTLRDSHYNCL
jgi:hypothetical protein